MRSNRTVVILTAMAATAALTACSTKKPERAREPGTQMSERQRDSTITHSKLPGAGVVGRAMEQADSATARAARENAASQQ